MPERKKKQKIWERMIEEKKLEINYLIM